MVLIMLTQKPAYFHKISKTFKTFSVHSTTKTYQKNQATFNQVT